MNLFACSLKDMSGIDLSVACHKLNVNPLAKHVRQKMCHQSIEKAQVAKEILRGILKPTSFQKSTIHSGSQTSSW